MAHSKQYVRLMNSRQWRETRNTYVASHPLCERCKERGRIRATQCVHHIVPVESGLTDRDCEQLCFSLGNLQSLCYECHAEVHRMERSHSKEAHHQRQSERLERWINRHRRN